MDSSTINLLNHLNHEFYQTVASSFDGTRSTPWPGWVQLLPSLPSRALRVLDVGCGNGRFALFLSEHRQIHYTGIDNNPYLLKRAEILLKEQKIDAALVQADVLQEFPAVQPPYDLITAFGLMHHIPGFNQRKKLLQQLAGWLPPDGILAVTFWTFYEQERFRQRIVEWDDPRVPEPYRNLTVEKHDYLLDWRRDTPALRYCHYVDAEEQQKLMEGFKILASYDADGSNRYVILRI
ncbi:MAG: class I SAM-dependent methyltransferase [Anaerolineae bacterium]|nr:class I SAM-dependent methyltransferase [Anaerolineae bacterium]